MSIVTICICVTQEVADVRTRPRFLSLTHMGTGQKNAKSLEILRRTVVALSIDFVATNHNKKGNAIAQSSSSSSYHTNHDMSNNKNKAKIASYQRNASPMELPSLQEEEDEVEEIEEDSSEYRLWVVIGWGRDN